MATTRKLIIGVNDLATTHPEVAKFWHAQNSVTAQQVTAGSERKVWWQADCEHKWEAPIANMVQKSKGCPYCSNRRVLIGFNDLATTNPDLSAMWNDEKNGTLTPEQITSGSAKKVWWKCAEDHEWIAEIRVERRCQVCAHRKVLAGYNDITVTAPEIAADFHPVKNNDLNVQEILAGSIKKVWWLGKNCGHEWEAAPHSRIKLRSGCPVCVNQKVLSGYNDLTTVAPELAAEWNYEKNGSLLPEHVPAGTGKKVWWICDKGHEWEAVILNRKRTGCPYCSGAKALKGFNDLLHKHPDVAAQWHPTKNSPLLPEDVTSGSDRKIWWQCLKHHEWRAGVFFRTANDGGCPECWYNSFISKAEQEIADFIASNGMEIVQSNRKILSGGELDIYIPSHKIAIEYNGLYWHSENQGKDSTYHQTKYLACKDLGIQLIQIWEDDWNRSPEQIKAMLLRKLDISQENALLAVETTVTTIPVYDAESFLEQHHVQGYATGSSYLGLRVKSSQEIVAVLVLETADNAMNIVRYATNKLVVGGFEMLLKYAEVTYKLSSITSVIDNTIADDELYGSSGFIVDQEVDADYFYVVNGKRQSKAGYPLERFLSDSNLKYEEGLTELELADLNGILRVWDAGKTCWVRVIKE